MDEERESQDKGNTSEGVCILSLISSVLFEDFFRVIVFVTFVTFVMGTRSTCT